MRLKTLYATLLTLSMISCASTGSSLDGNHTALPQSVDTTEAHSVWSGSAFFINAEGYLATANHVVQGGTGFKVYYRGAYYPAHVVITDTEHDVAIVKTDIVPDSYLSLTKDETNKGNIGVYGFPLGTLVVTITQGKASYGTGFSEDTVSVDARGCHGNSGGPIIDDSGNAVGQYNWGIADNDPECFTEGGGPTIKYIIALANRGKIPIDVESSTSKYSFAHIMYNYHDAIVYIEGSN